LHKNINKEKLEKQVSSNKLLTTK